MICRSCRTGMLSRLQQQQAAVSWTASTSARQFPIARSQFRFYSDSGANPSVAATPPPSTPRQPTVGDVTVPSAISSATPGVSQPLSTPEGVHTEAHPDAPIKTSSRPPSSCPAGTKMNGLNYFRNKPEVLAKEDSEYPEWLWDLLSDSSKQSKTEKGGVDPSSTSTITTTRTSQILTQSQPLTRSNESVMRRSSLLAPKPSLPRFPPTTTPTISRLRHTTATHPLTASPTLPRVLASARRLPRVPEMPAGSRSRSPTSCAVCKLQVQLCECIGSSGAIWFENFSFAVAIHIHHWIWDRRARRPSGQSDMYYYVD
jgi:hypothetical protein